MHDCLIVHLKNNDKNCTGVRRQNVSDFEILIQKVTDLVWYILPHVSKFTSHAASIPNYFSPFLKFNDPQRHKHSAKQLAKELLLQHTDEVFTCLEKSYISGPTLNFFKSEVESLLTAVIKYCDYLDYNLEQIRQSQGINEEPLKDNSIYPLPFNTATIHEAYKMPREQCCRGDRK